ncbi:MULTISPECIES: pyruvate ferredoxin oxidoreductase subunit gamma [unclassified Methanopyrus]|uniref:pyruvate ferredoxin oxidoreductase subunit gamma n=1 Tax=Methanopyrus sp. SNP6 TaxID=1937005 RepID=UPI0011E5D0E4|nr:pyruvate ferredoxin oxidoreductase subunit gamma [Methanopyrus sp. SNP6]
MIEIRIHGRGGQGAVTAAEILAIAAKEDGKYSQAFPFFGVERRGAPVTAFARIDDEFIKIRSQIYEPDHVIVLDSSLLAVVDVTEGLSEDGLIVINSREESDEVAEEFEDFDVYVVDATQIALDELGIPIVNTAMVGAYLKASDVLTLDAVKEAIHARFSGEIAEKNVRVVERAYREVKAVG